MLISGLTICPKGWGMTDECASFFRMYYVLGGKAWMKTENGDLPLERGRFYVFPVMKPYTLCHDEGDPLDVLWFHVEMRTDMSLELGCCDIEEGSAMFHILSAIKELIKDPDMHEDMLELFDVFLTLLMEKVPLKNAKSRRMGRALDYIEANIGEGAGVESVAAHVGMERSYFSRKFKKTFNMSPASYILSRKMSAAAAALESGATVKAAAAAAGYADDKSFSRAFSAYMETPPGRYARSHTLQP